MTIETVESLSIAVTNAKQSQQELDSRFALDTDLGILLPEEIEPGKCPHCHNTNIKEVGRCEGCGFRGMKCNVCGCTWQECLP